MFLYLCCLVAYSGALPSREQIVADIHKMGHGNIFDGLQDDAAIDGMIDKFLRPSKVVLTKGQGESQYLTLDHAQVDPSQIVAIGKAAWEIVKENQPVVNVSVDYAGAVPQGVNDWTELAGWRDFVSEPYNISFVNFANARLTELDYTWSFKYNGKWNGTGLYVTQAGAVIEKIYAYLTETVEVRMTAFDPINYGTQSDPMAGIDLELSMTSYGYFEKNTVTCHVICRGDGTFQEVACAKGPQPGR